MDRLRKEKYRRPADKQSVYCVSDDRCDDCIDKSFGLKGHAGIKNLHGKMAIPRGDLKIAARPAAIPARTKVRRSSSGKRMTSARIEPTPTLICAVGPSRPAAPPDPIVMADAIAL